MGRNLAGNSVIQTLGRMAPRKQRAVLLLAVIWRRYRVARALCRDLTKRAAALGQWGDCAHVSIVMPAKLMGVAASSTARVLTDCCGAPWSRVA